jgi:hypothetical protein
VYLKFLECVERCEYTGRGSHLDEVTVLLAFLEKWGCLSNVRVNPYTDLEITVFKPFKIASGVGEHLGIELEVAPLIRLHPETIEVENAQRDISVPEAVEETGNRLLVVVCRKA